ncbi:hypothetical protein NZD88_00570 [Chryseobacterium antibioticum]|uniref:DUF3887 domain-containing protein n=1 Tax=Chryseobacterium pyrolae TaxID=2987481 RepID=A0ABT2IBN7_9FLAO|nr:hypothetical protein [Chryseobacterium pyrolae]MCT2406044.1 hypothetical protein [Chryseobacterium pyrolae]
MNRAIKNLLLFASILLVLTSCHSETFDSAQWVPIESGLYDGHRKKMLNDLVENVLTFESGKHRGTSKEKVINLIGKPNEIDTKDGSEIYYIEEKTGMIDPNGYINLHLTYKSDSTLMSWKIENVDYKE